MTAPFPADAPPGGPQLRRGKMFRLTALVAVAALVAAVSSDQSRDSPDAIPQMSRQVSANALDARPHAIVPRLMLMAARADTDAAGRSSAEMRAVAVWPLFAVGVGAAFLIVLIVRHRLRRSRQRLAATRRRVRELEDMIETLRKTDAAKTRYVAQVGDELRAPLTAVLGFAQIAQTRLDTVIFPALPEDDPRSARAVAQVRENIGILIAEGLRLTKIIDDILDLDRIEAGRMAWEIEPLDIGSVIRQAAAATHGLHAAKGLAFHLDIADDLPPVRGDRDRLVQVLTHLIANAVAFTERGHVTCTARRDPGPFVSVAIRDTGIGIAASDLPGLFDRFRVVGDGPRAASSGLGLGLPICRGIVDQLGGSITVESTPGQGSTFTLRLPLSDTGDEGTEAPGTDDGR